MRKQREEKYEIRYNHCNKMYRDHQKTNGNETKTQVKAVVKNIAQNEQILET